MATASETEMLEQPTWQERALPNPFIVSITARSSEPDEDLIFALTINETISSTPPPKPISQADDEKTATIAKSNRTPRGIGLLGAIFDELSVQLGEEFSSAELMRAAQLLIDTSKSEYVANPYKDPVDRAGYFSWDLVRAFRQAWHVAEVETYKMEHCYLEDLSLETMESARLLQQGWHEPMWEF
jgi:hypothetical protein